MADIFKTTKLCNPATVFELTVNDEHGKVIRHPISSKENCIDFQCLHFEENFVNFDDLGAKLDNFDQLNERFIEMLQESENMRSFDSQSSTETVINSYRICKKCGHDILQL